MIEPELGERLARRNIQKELLMTAPITQI